jgi:CSLREA domain-containing protein
MALLGLFLISVSAHAAVVFTVNTPSDGFSGAFDANPGDGVCETAPGNGICTLRAAIQEANALAGDDTIILSPNTYQLSINLIDSALIIAGNLTITGGGATTTTIRGGVESQVLVINGRFAVNLSGVTILGAGLAGSGISNGGTATLINSTVSGNANLGGISNSGTLTLINSTVSGNLSAIGGGIRNSGTLTLINSTVSGNRVTDNGGGIFNSGVANVSNSTITNNQAGETAFFGSVGTGGGVFNASGAKFNFQNTILAGNFETVGIPAPPPIKMMFVSTPGECDGTINSIGSNLMTIANCTVSGSAPILGNPNLGPLQNNGPTQTHALLSDSPAIDAGDPGGCRDEFGALLTTDQRGFNRPAWGCDIGAFELQQATGVVAAVLPSSRSVQVNTPAAAFATVINTGQAIATGCSIAPLTSLPASFVYQTTDPATNQVIGFPNTPVNIAAGAAQSFVFALTPTAPIASTDVQFSFDCADTDPAPVNVGLNTFLVSASDTPVSDIVALAVTLSNDGIVNIPGTNGAGAFAVATVNLGATETITASADTGTASLPLNISLCQTEPATGQCMSVIGPTVTTAINANATPTFGIFVHGNGNVPFDPAVNRIFVRFKDGDGVTRGSTSVAVRTQ